MIARACAVLALLLVALAPSLVSAHGLRPGVLTLVEREPGVFTLSWTEPVDTAGNDASVEIVFPEPCRPATLATATTGDTLDCGAGGLAGAIEVRGLEGDRARVMALVRMQDGREVEALLGEDDPQIDVAASPGRSALAWILLGIEHILVGIDHIAFVLGLMLVVGTRSVRRLVATITAFTIAHSITLVLAATDTLVLSTAPVEATIAASVVLVARESLHDRATLTRRAPWIVAFVFGLVHGLGFAGALASFGLPEGWLGWSLVCFNVGVEAGQLAIVLASVAIVRTIGPALSNKLQRPVAYAIGGLSAYWLLDRAIPILAALLRAS
jgi:hypothetical protein